MKCVAIILARAGSRRIINKNIKDFHGRPIIEYPIETAKESKLFDDIIVATNSEDALMIAHRMNVHSFYRRRDVDDEATTIDAMAHICDYMDINDAEVCCIYPCSPLMTAMDLNRGFMEVGMPNILYSFSVGTNPLRDAGNFYFGKAEAWRKKVPIFAEHSAMIPIDESRVIDVNTMDDWFQAEKMYGEIHGIH